MGHIACDDGWSTACIQRFLIAATPVATSTRTGTAIGIANQCREGLRAQTQFAIG